MSSSWIPDPPSGSSDWRRPRSYKALWDDAWTAIQGGNSVSLRASLPTPDDNCYFNPLDWAKLASEVGKPSSNLVHDCRRETALALWEGFKATLETAPRVVFGDAFTEFALLFVRQRKEGEFDEVLQSIANRPSQFRGIIHWRPIIDEVVKGRSAALARPLCQQITPAGGFLPFRDSSLFLGWQAEAGNPVGIQAALQHASRDRDDRFFLENWDRCFEITLNALALVSLPRADCVAMLFAAAEEQSYWPGPRHWVAAVSLLVDEWDGSRLVEFLRRANLLRDSRDWTQIIGTLAGAVPVNLTALAALLDLADDRVLLRPWDYFDLLLREIKREAAPSVSLLLERMSTARIFMRSDNFSTMVRRAIEIRNPASAASILIGLFTDVNVSAWIEKENFHAAYGQGINLKLPEVIMAASARMNKQGTFLEAQEWGVLASQAMTHFDPMVARALWDGVSEQSRAFIRTSSDVFSRFRELEANCPEESRGWPGLESMGMGHEEATGFSNVIVRVTQAGEANDLAGFETTLREIELSFEKRNSRNVRKEWNLVFSAVEDLDTIPEGFGRALWKACSKHYTRFLSTDFALLAKIAGTGRDHELLTELFDHWEPRQTTLETVDHYGRKEGKFSAPPEHDAWDAFLKAALAYQDEALLLRVVERLYHVYDPARSPHTGSLWPLLSGLPGRIRDDSLRDRLSATIHGRDWTVEEFMKLLRAWPPATSRIDHRPSRFEGAARCLMKLWINRSFTTNASAFAAITLEIVTGLKELPRFQEVAWTAFLSSGWENLRGNLVTVYRDRYLGSMSHLLEISDELAFANRVENGDVAKCLGEYISSFKGNSHAANPPSPGAITFGSPAAELDVITRRIIAWVEAGQDPEIRRKDEFREDIAEYCQAYAPHRLATADACAYLCHMLEMVKESAMNGIEAYAISQIHEGKRSFIEDFQVPMAALEEDEPRMRLARYAKARLSNGYEMLENLRWSPLVEINLSKAVNKVLVKSFIDAGHRITGARELGIMVAGRMTSKETALVPMLKEIFRNAQRALEQSSTGERQVSIDLVTQEGVFGPEARLTVINSIAPDPTPDPISNKMGLVTLKQWAAYFRSMDSRANGIVGTYESPPETAPGTFRIDVILPLPSRQAGASSPPDARDEDAEDYLP